MGGWKTIAKNEIRLWTTKFRNNRKLFFEFMTIFLVIFNIIFLGINQLLITPFREADLFEKLFATFVIIPVLPLSPVQKAQLQGLFLNNNIFSSMATQLIPPFMAMICFYLFFMAFSFPIQTSIQQINVSHFEIVLSSPIKARDMMLGNFLGRVPIYVIADFIVVPILCTILSLFIPLSSLSFIIIGVVILILFIIGTYLGTITASYISLKLGQSENAADKAKVFAFLMTIVIALPTFAMSSFPFIFTDPNVQLMLKFIPTTWFGEIINVSIFPNYLPHLDLLIYIGLSALFSIGIFLFGYKYGDKTYNLELGTHNGTMKITEDGIFYKLFKRLFGNLFVIQLKEFFRRKENILKLFYITGIAILIPLSMTLFSQQYSNPMTALMGEGMPREMPLLITGWVFAIMIIPMLGSYIMVRSKDMVWIFKKSPRGISALIYPFLQVYSLMAAIVIIPVTIIVSLFNGLDILTSIIFLIGLFMWVFSALTISIGIQCWRPAFKENSAKMGINIFISMSFFFGMFPLIFIPLDWLSTYSIIVFPLILILISIVVLRFGMSKLQRIE